MTRAFEILVLIGLAAAPQFRTTQHLTSGELLESEDRDLLPKGVSLRPVYVKGLSLTKTSEGWEPRLYNDVANYCSIGYGHLIKRAPCDGGEPPQYLKGLTKPQGENLLVEDLGTSQYSVMRSVSTPLTDGQFAALVDFCFNVGSEKFKTSSVLKVVNAGQHDRVPGQLRRWVMAGAKPWPGLVTRREREIEVYFDGAPAGKGLPRRGEDLSPIDIRIGESRR